MIYKAHSNSFLQEINLESSIVFVLLPRAISILYLICFFSGKCHNTPKVSQPKVVFEFDSYYWTTPGTFCPDNLKLRPRLTRLAKISSLEWRGENIPEKQVSGSHICNTWNLTLGMMHHYYLKGGECCAEHTSGQNSFILQLQSQVATGKWTIDQELGHRSFSAGISEEQSPVL